MTRLRELLLRCAPYPVRGRILEGIALALFEGAELVVERVVLRVGDGGRVLFVVKLRIAVELFDKLFHFLVSRHIIPRLF